jgi:hypothetical protein
MVIDICEHTTIKNKKPDQPTSFTPRNLSEFVTTLTELNTIAPAQ